MGIAFASAADPSRFRARQFSPSSRGTALIISEIMYHPREAGDTEALEYIEIFNTEPVREEMSGYRISGDIDFTFPPARPSPGAASSSWRATRTR